MAAIEITDNGNRLHRIDEIDRLSEEELQAMSARELSEVRHLLLEKLESDLKLLFAKPSKNKE
jgi:hypothetical protein